MRTRPNNISIFGVSAAAAFVVAFAAAPTLFGGSSVVFVQGQQDPPRSYLPEEDGEHEATWLAWPNDYGWDPDHVFRYESIWLAMTVALAPTEKVNILVYNQAQKTTVTRQLQTRNVPMSQITLYIWRTSDVWIRDYGPLFTIDGAGRMLTTDWGYNGWGRKVPANEWRRDDKIPRRVKNVLKNQLIAIPEMVLEGGAIEVDGAGTLMAKRSCIINNNRNPGWSQADIEEYMEWHFEIENFIWLDGVTGQGDITDDHIDGTARFARGNKIVTHKREDYPRRQRGEYDILAAATNARGVKYEIVHLPITDKIVAHGDHGLYINYYVANRVVIVPAYDDINDDEAARILGNLYPGYKVVSIDMTELYKDGGVAHCVTMQQPKV